MGVVELIYGRVNEDGEADAAVSVFSRDMLANWKARGNAAQIARCARDLTSAGAAWN